MSRVFLAEETRLGRQVVVKVLPPEMGAAVNIGRFEREIQLCARLQHPHIVPLLTAGASGDLLYYIMPFIAGESLRAKLARHGELPIAEAARILREIVDALAYAHRNGVVHRDIKPDNVLLSEGHAVVTDFGVAKAVSASSGKSSLTSLGVALGTPAYMAPEQAAADPHVDHRADIYAVGTLAYEMLTGRLPFMAATAQAMLAAHITQTPDPLIQHRPTVSPVLNSLVMRCLEKRPADRWQSAAELVPQLDAAMTPIAGMTPSEPPPVISSGTRRAIRISEPGRVAALFVIASLVILATVYFVVLQVGLPWWVLGAAAGLLVAGLPVMLATARHERHRAVARTAGMTVTTPANGLQRWLTWRKALMGGAAAFGVLALVSGGYTAMRLLGIGPVGTLMASGTLHEREPLLLADFADHAPDTTLGTSLTEAFRVDLAQSAFVRLADQQTVREALQRMEHTAVTGLPAALAREVAERAGIRAVVTGQIDPVGKGYVLSASLISPGDGQVLTAVRETAASDADLLAATDHLSKHLRERIGESLVTIRQDRPLEQVTTASLPALRKYSEAVRLFKQARYEDALPLLRQAVTLDSGFAMAWRKLASIYYNLDAPSDQFMQAAQRAYDHRDRLPEIERDQTIGMYFMQVEYDPARSQAAYRAVLAIDSTDPVALNNMAMELNFAGSYVEAESLALRGFRSHPQAVIAGNLAMAEIGQGHFADADRTMREQQKLLPGSPTMPLEYRLLWARGRYRAADSAIRVFRQQHADSPSYQLIGTMTLGDASVAEGRIDEARQAADTVMDQAEATGNPSLYLRGAIDKATLDLDYGSGADAALGQVAAALALHPLSSIPPVSRPYARLASFYARAGRPQLARQELAEQRSLLTEGLRRGDAGIPLAEGETYLAEGRLSDAVAAFQGFRNLWAGPAGLYGLARVYDRMGQADSARIYYQRAVDVPSADHINADLDHLAPALKRLGELFEAHGDNAAAARYYGRFVDLWQNADPALQPTVRDIRQRLARFTAESDR